MVPLSILCRPDLCIPVANGFECCTLCCRISPSTMRTLLLILVYLIADTALTDPCVDHTVLDQSWRSMNCNATECTGNLQCDAYLVQGWYRFNSSGGWKIPETEVPSYHCSANAPGWLNGIHPTVGQGEVTRTVCFNYYGNPCQWTRDIKIKNCTNYSVYELKPTDSCYLVYCTDPETSPTQGLEEQSTRETTDHSSTIPESSSTSDHETSPTQGLEEQSTRETTDCPSTIPAGSAASVPETFPTQGPDEQSTRETTDRPSTIPEGSSTSDHVTSATQGLEEQSTRETTDCPSTIPAGSAASDESDDEGSMSKRGVQFQTGGR
uniref:uncharacterized protein F26C11.3-like isoform X2 n=1 Tax=Pristiophorus japonicus TaxID=55135 RepID=UPI00398EDDFC